MSQSEACEAVDSNCEGLRRMTIWHGHQNVRSEVLLSMLEICSRATGRGREDRLSGLRVDQEEGRRVVVQEAKRGGDARG